MMRDFSHIWAKGAFANPALTTSMVKVAETRLGVGLPQEYLEALKIRNGGYTVGLAFPTTEKTSWSEDHVPFLNMTGIDVDGDELAHLNVLQTAYMTKEWGLPEKQVILTGEGHWWITLDYRAGDQPTVSWFDVEIGEDIILASSFLQFVEKLVPISNFRSYLPDDVPAPSVWDPKRITFLIEEPNEFTSYRCLRLDNDLEEGERGWTILRMALPELWCIAELGFFDDEFRIILEDGRQFVLNADNRTTLKTALLAADPSHDSGEVEQLWIEYALKTKKAT